MNNYYKYRLKWKMHRFVRKSLQIFGKELAKPKMYCGKTVLSLEAAHTYIEQNIRSGRPFAVLRFGGVELNAFWPWDSPFRITKSHMKRMLGQACINAGFFPNEPQALKRFAEEMRRDCKMADAFAVWFFPMEDYCIATYGNPQEIILPRSLEPWYVDRPWTAALAGKKVLVIHPFKDTILQQYEKREKLFKNQDILPEFAELHVVKAVQTIAGTKDERFADWFEALEWMFTEAMKVDFDVAIIGCGAYGFPLAAKIKAAGKQAIHMGGATQLLFGIKGSRWENHPIISKLFNEHWVYPAESERPSNASIVEGACYW